MALCNRLRGTNLLSIISKTMFNVGDLRRSVCIHNNLIAPRKFGWRFVTLKDSMFFKLLPCYNKRSYNHQLTTPKWFSTTLASPSDKPQARRNTCGTPKAYRSTLYYIAALGVASLGLSYAAVPLYRIFCQAYSYGGTTQKGHDAEKVESMQKVEDRVITVRFNADTAASMTWNFKPQQSEIKVLPGETALAFYTACNPTERPVIGVSTYNVIPFDAGQYFNKIQCFCFEEQLLNPHEVVHMPVFFYIDPEFVDDPKMENVDQLTLSYTFFEAREGVTIPIQNITRNSDI